MGKVLLVDDEREFLDVLEVSMNDAGFEVTTANSGIEALKIIRSKVAIDCILTDLSMPEMRGDELARLIKDETDIPVIIMTADHSAPFEQLHRSGISGILNKPVNSHSFIEFLKDNDLHIVDEESRLRKFLRQASKVAPEICISNGRETVDGSIRNFSTGGLGLTLKKSISPISTVKFKLTRGEESVSGFMHCRWKSKQEDKIKAGFEFDSITKKALAANKIFCRWIKISNQ